MKKAMSYLFRWQPTKDTLAAAAAGLVVFLLSWAMIPARGLFLLNTLLRDVLMIFLVGIAFPLWYIRRNRENMADFGLTWKRWYLYLPINLVLGGLLLLMFLKEVPLPADFQLKAGVLFRISFIMIAGVFEVVFFYSFQRSYFERAFGTVPAILVTAAFYAFHHIGFQPEYGKLIMVGIMYALVFRLGNSALLIFPFFWGVGGCYDVLVQSKVVSEFTAPGLRSVILIVLLSVVLPQTLKRLIPEAANPKESIKEI
ncbi:MAG: hypothetical protein K9L21_04405 [Spirochaetia bacterium]|nr:hypothetical protein [Spirochaetia bacterium]